MVLCKLNTLVTFLVWHVSWYGKIDKYCFGYTKNGYFLGVKIQGRKLAYVAGKRKGTRPQRLT